MFILIIIIALFSGPVKGNGVHNDINTRQLLFFYDRPLFELIHKMFPCGNWLPKRCDLIKTATNPRDFMKKFDQRVAALGKRKDCKYQKIIQLTPGGEFVHY